MRIILEPPHDKTNKMACAPSEDSNQTGHSHSLIRVFAVHMKKAWALSYPLSAQRRLWSDWADAQIDLSLRWAHMPFCWFCHEAAHFVSTYFACDRVSLDRLVYGGLWAHLFVYFVCVALCLSLFLLTSLVDCGLCLWHSLKWYFNCLPRWRLETALKDRAGSTYSH